MATLLERSGKPVLERHAAAIRTYEQEARLGRSLDEVLGPSACGGAGPWWSRRLEFGRDEAIRGVWRFYLNHEAAAAADQISRLASRRMMARSAAVTDKEALIQSALRTGVIPSASLSDTRPGSGSD